MIVNVGCMCIQFITGLKLEHIYFIWCFICCKNYSINDNFLHLSPGVLLTTICVSPILDQQK